MKQTLSLFCLILPTLVDGRSPGSQADGGFSKKPAREQTRGLLFAKCATALSCPLWILWFALSKIYLARSSINGSEAAAAGGKEQPVDSAEFPLSLEDSRRISLKEELFEQIIDEICSSPPQLPPHLFAIECTVCLRTVGIPVCICGNSSLVSVALMHACFEDLLLKAHLLDSRVQGVMGREQANWKPLGNHQA